MQYYAAFVAGTQGIVETIIRERLADAVIQKLLEGAVIFETQCPYSGLNFFCFNNIFAVISVFENPRPGGALESHMEALCRGGRNPVVAENNRKIRTFRIVTSRENRLVPVNEKIKEEAERYIAAQTGLTLDRSSPDTEFWFLYRSEGFSVCMKRLTKPGTAEKTRHPGELSPPLAYMLCRLSNPKPGEAAADPFCGYGSIPEQRQKHFPPAQFYASDINQRAVAYSRNKIKGTLRNRCCFQQSDIYDLPSLLPKDGLDAIITDPPWGLYGQTPVPPGQFYEDMIRIFAELLKPRGAAVILTAREEELRGGTERSGQFEIRETIPILVSGKKACIFVLKRL
jgi:hypothetical protein